MTPDAVELTIRQGKRYQFSRPTPMTEALPAADDVDRQSLPEDLRRDVRDAVRWVGLSPNDALLLASFLIRVDPLPDALYTHVPVMSPADLPPELDNAENRRLYGCLWPRRVDAIMVWPTDKWLVELKPINNYVALGQLLVYTFHAAAAFAELANVRPVLICDTVDPGILPLYRRHGIDVVELPGTLITEGPVTS